MVGDFIVFAFELCIINLKMKRALLKSNLPRDTWPKTRQDEISRFAPPGGSNGLSE